MKLDTFVVGKTYTRRQIHNAVGGGDLVSYLPEKDGRILAGCFKPDLNQRAPHEIDAGGAPEVIRKARAVAATQAIIPLFLKRQSNQWEYCGVYKCLRFSQAARDIRAHKNRRYDTAGVLYFEGVTDDQHPVPDTELLEMRAKEGGLIFVMHLAKERKRGLILAKRSEVRNSKGCLICEACGLKETQFPQPMGEACFEVHHCVPLSSLRQETETKLADLAMLCANCHRIVHRTNPMLTVSQLSRLLKGNYPA